MQRALNYDAERESERERGERGRGGAYKIISIIGWQLIYVHYIYIIHKQGDYM